MATRPNDTARETEPGVCPGPLVWFDTEGGAILECAACPYLIVTGSFHDPTHAHTPLMREGLAAW